MRQPTFEKAPVAFLLMAWLCSASIATAAETSGKLTGEYRLNAETCKAGKNGPGCEIYFEIHGAAAKTIYLNMKTKAVADECTGGMVKSDGKSMRCFFTDGKTYDCDVGYNFEKEQLVASDVTC